MSDFWPNDLNDVSDTLPVSPILEQAKLLANHTANIVKAEVFPLDTHDGVFQFDFDLVVRILDYRFTLFKFHYGVQGYPVFLIPTEKISSELDLKLMNTELQFTRAFKANNPDQLTRNLAKILGSHTTRTILETLIAQGKKFKG